MTITYFALHQLGRGDIMLPEDAQLDDDGIARAEFSAPTLVSHAPRSRDGRVYYDAVACYNERGQRERVFATETKWVIEGEWVAISANNFLP